MRPPAPSPIFVASQGLFQLIANKVVNGPIFAGLWHGNCIVLGVRAASVWRLTREVGHEKQAGCNYRNPGTDVIGFDVHPRARGWSPLGKSSGDSERPTAGA